MSHPNISQFLCEYSNREGTQINIVSELADGDLASRILRSKDEIPLLHRLYWARDVLEGYCLHLHLCLCLQARHDVLQRRDDRMPYAHMHIRSLLLCIARALLFFPLAGLSSNTCDVVLRTSMLAPGRPSTRRLRHMHSNHMVHRDLKLVNVLYTVPPASPASTTLPLPIAKLTDFGMCQLIPVSCGYLIDPPRRPLGTVRRV